MPESLDDEGDRLLLLAAGLGGGDFFCGLTLSSGFSGSAGLASASFFFAFALADALLVALLLLLLRLELPDELDEPVELDLDPLLELPLLADELYRKHSKGC